MANNYAKAIDIVANDCDWKALVLEIAKIAPSVIVKAADAVKNSPWQKQVTPLLDDKVAAIRLCRELTGMSLMDAKSAVERMIDAERSGSD